MSTFAVDADDVTRAATTIAGDVVRTPTTRSQTLSLFTGADVTLKLENLQFTASFKERGAVNKLRSLSPDERAAGVVAVSAGNHAQAVAHHATRLGIHATIVMPVSAPFTKVNNTRALGAEVVQAGRTFAEAVETAEALASQRHLTWVHPYDDPAVIAGQGTVAVELLADAGPFDAVLVPVGGGGLLAGMATYLRSVCPHMEIIGVEASTYPGLAVALAGGKVEDAVAPAPPLDTLADGLAVKQPGRLTLPIIRDLVDDVILVEEATIEHAVSLLIEIEKTVVEGAGAVGLAALLAQPDRFRGRRVALPLTGGNIDLRVLASVLMRELVHSGRVSTLRITLPDLPGQLAPVLTMVGEAGANVIEIDHRRLFDPITARTANVDVVVETRDRSHANEVIDLLARAGYRAVVANGT